MLKMFLLKRGIKRLSLCGNLVWKEAYDWDMNIECPSLESITMAFLQDLLFYSKNSAVAQSVTLLLKHPLIFWRKVLATKVRPMRWGLLMTDRPNTWPELPPLGSFKNWLQDFILHHTSIIKSKKTYKSLVDFHALCVGWVMY